MKISLAAIRVNADITQKELAKKMKVSNKTINNWETGKVNISKERLQEFCKECKFPPEECTLYIPPEA